MNISEIIKHANPGNYTPNGRLYPSAMPDGYDEKLEELPLTYEKVGQPCVEYLERYGLVKTVIIDGVRWVFEVPRVQ